MVWQKYLVNTFWWVLEAMFIVSVFLELTWIVSVPRSIKLWSALLQCQHTLCNSYSANTLLNITYNLFFSWYNRRFESSLAVLPTKQFTHHLHAKSMQTVTKLWMVLTQHCVLGSCSLALQSLEQQDRMQQIMKIKFWLFLLLLLLCYF